jgi:hypothetical protein
MKNLDVSSLAELAQPLLTVYLDTDTRESDNQRYVPSYFTWLKAAANTRRAQVPERERKLFDAQLKRVETFLANQRSRPRGLLIFGGPKTWEQIAFELPLANELHWGKPALSQLISVLNEQMPSCIVAVDRMGARYFRYFAGEMQEYPEQRFLIDTSQWKRKEHAHMARRATRMPHGPERDAFTHRVEDEYRHLYRQVADRTKTLCAKDRFSSIFLVGAKRFIVPIESQLPRDLRGRVVLVDEDLARIPQRALQRHLAPVIAARATDVMRRRVDDLLNGGDRTVVGIDETLAQVQAGAISTLIFVHGLETTLRRCTACGAASRSADPVCVSCGGRRERIMLRDALPELARINRCEIEVVSAEAGIRLSASGGIGGWRRRQTREASRVRARL